MPASYNYYVFGYCVENQECADKLLVEEVLPFVRKQKLKIIELFNENKQLLKTIKARDSEMAILKREIEYLDRQVRKRERSRSNDRIQDKHRSSQRRERSRSNDRTWDKKRQQSRSPPKDRVSERKRPTTIPLVPPNSPFITNDELDDFLANAKRAAELNSLSKTFPIPAFMLSGNNQ